MKIYSLLFAFVLPATLLAQTDNSKEAEQIIITKKGNANEKLNIVVDGNKVTVNGNPVSSDKNQQISVTRKRIKDIDVYNDNETGNTDGRITRRRFATPQTPLPPMANKAMLGVSTQKVDDGIEVINVTEESAAAKAGIKEGDIIIEADHKKIETPDDLSKAIAQKEIGDKVSIVYIRDAKQNKTVAELTKWNAPQVLSFGNSNNFNMPDFDMEELFRQMPQQRNGRTFYNISPRNNDQKLGIRVQDLDNNAGVKVIDVQDGSNAAKAGIKKGDIVMEINGKPATNGTLLAATVRLTKPGTTLKLKVERNNKLQNIDVHLPKDVKETDL